MQKFSISAAGLHMTKGFEGLRLTAYRDVVGVLTIGYGHTGPDVRVGQVITEEQAELLLVRDMQSAADCVNHAVQVPVSQGQFDAMADFAFNLGNRAFTSSHLLACVNANKFAEAAGQFGLWVHAGGKVVPGLVTRRAAEAALFEGRA